MAKFVDIKDAMASYRSRYTSDGDLILVKQIVKERLLDDATSCLSIGAGNGEGFDRHFVHLALPQLKSYVAVDCDEDSCIALRQLIATEFPTQVKGRVDCSRVQDWKPTAEDGKFDVVVAYEMFCYFSGDELRAVLRRIFQEFLKPNGVFLVSVDSPDSYYGKVVSRLWPAFTETALTTASLTREIEPLGFTVAREYVFDGVRDLQQPFDDAFLSLFYYHGWMANTNAAETNEVDLETIRKAAVEEAGGATTGRVCYNLLAIKAKKAVINNA